MSMHDASYLSIGLIYGKTYEIVAYSSLSLLRLKPATSTAADWAISLLFLSTVCCLLLYVCALRAARKNKRGLLAEVKHFAEDNLLTLVRLSKTAVAGFLAAALIDHPVVQSLGLLAVEAAYLCLLLLRLENRRHLRLINEAILTSTFCLLLVLKMISFADLSYQNLDEIGNLMFGIICIMFCVQVYMAVLFHLKIYLKRRQRRRIPPRAINL